MRLFLKILIVIVAAAVATIAYLLWMFYDLSVQQANYIKTEAARAARWAVKKNPEETPEPEVVNSSSTKSPVVESEVVETQNENQNEKGI